MPAVITFAFDPLLHIGDNTVRIETIALGLVLFAGLLLLARIGQLTPAPGPYVPAPTLELGDLPFLVLGAVPGAVLGGRLDYVLVHLDYYASHASSIVDPGQGALGLGLAVPGAILGAATIARLIGAPLERWLHAAVLPTLFVLAAAKLAGVLAASGQGAPSDAAWATAYLGDGPWDSLAAFIPSHPSQVYEAILATAILVILGLTLRAGAFARRDGSALFVGLALWAVARLIVATTWRDATVVGALRAEQVVLLGVVAGCAVTLRRLRAR